MTVRIIEDRRAEIEVIAGKEKVVRIETTEIIAETEVTAGLEMIPEIEIEEVIPEIEIEDHLVANIGEDLLITLVEDHHRLEEVILEVTVETIRDICLEVILKIVIMRKR